jgi:hypothetical protein
VRKSDARKEARKIETQQNVAAKNMRNKAASRAMSELKEHPPFAKIRIKTIPTEVHGITVKVDVFTCEYDGSSAVFSTNEAADKWADEQRKNWIAGRNLTEMKMQATHSLNLIRHSLAAFLSKYKDIAEQDELDRARWAIDMLDRGRQ